jgi:hypothetical protein
MESSTTIRQKFLRDLFLVCIPVALTAVVTLWQIREQIESSEKAIYASIEADNINTMAQIEAQKSMLLTQLKSQQKLFDDGNKEAIRKMDISFDNSIKLINKQFEQSQSLLEREVAASREYSLDLISQTIDKEKELTDFKRKQRIEDIKLAISSDAIEFISNLFQADYARYVYLHSNMASYSLQKAYLQVFPDIEDLQRYPSVSHAYEFHEFNKIKHSEAISLTGKLRAYFSPAITDKFLKIYNREFSKYNKENQMLTEKIKIELTEFYANDLNKLKDMRDRNEDIVEFKEYLNEQHSNWSIEIEKRSSEYAATQAGTARYMKEVMELQTLMLNEIELSTKFN